MLDELCATTGWHRNHARKALQLALMPRIVRPRTPRASRYGPEVIVALAFCWAVLGAPTGKRLAPIMDELVPRLRRFEELRDQLMTPNWRCWRCRRRRSTAGWLPDRAKLLLRGHSHTKPGSLLKDSIPIRTWAEWNDAGPGFVEIDLVGHEGGNAVGEHCYTLTVTDIATGWTENRSLRNKARKWVVEALEDIGRVMPFPIIGIDSDNGSEFINYHLLEWCEQRKITFTRSRPGNSNDGAHVEQKNWAVVRTVVGYHRYDTVAELLLLNRIWVLQSQMTNYFCPQQKLIKKVRTGSKVVKKYDRATTPRRRAVDHPAVTNEDKTILTDTYRDLNPAAIQRQIQALTNELLTVTTSKAGARHRPAATTVATRASADDSTTPATRAS